jgi:hypothetical protein
MYRQGEVLIIPVIKIKGTKLSHRVIAEGEILGHKHELTSGELYEHEGVMYLKAESETVLNHPEHKAIELPKGNYQIIIQREYDELQDRRVRD